MATRQKLDPKFASRRDEKDAKRRSQILASDDFDKWYEARKEIQPFPSDPYRAFMIDRSLKAKSYDEDSWKDYVNRSDLHPVDSYRPEPDGPARPDMEPPVRRKHRTPDFIPSSKRRPEHDGEPLMESVKAHKKDFMTKWGLEDNIDIYVEHNPREGSAMAKPIAGRRPVLIIPEKFYQAVKKEGHKKTVMAQFETAHDHEFGHATQHQGEKDDWAIRAGTSVPKTPELTGIWGSVQHRETQKLRSEDYAWMVGKKYRESKGVKWKGARALAHRYYFGTYEGTRPSVMSGDKPLFQSDDSRQLIVRTPFTRNKPKPKRKK